MDLFPLSHVGALLGVDPKTLRLWLHEAGLTALPHPEDARQKCLSLTQIQQVAATHGRPLPPAFAPSTAPPSPSLPPPRCPLSTSSDATPDFHPPRAGHSPLAGAPPGLTTATLSCAAFSNRRHSSPQCRCPSSRPRCPSSTSPRLPRRAHDCLHRRWRLSGRRSRQRHPCPPSRPSSMVRLAGQHHHPHLSGPAWLLYRHPPSPPGQARPELECLSLPAWPFLHSLRGHDHDLDDRSPRRAGSTTPHPLSSPIN